MGDPLLKPATPVYPAKPPVTTVNPGKEVEARPVQAPKTKT